MSRGAPPRATGAVVAPAANLVSTRVGTDVSSLVSRSLPGAARPVGDQAGSAWLAVGSLIVV